MRRILVRLGRRLAPQLIDRLKDARDARRSRGLRGRVDSLEAEVRELKAEIDEARRDSLRIAQLADLVQERLNR